MEEGQFSWVKISQGDLIPEDAIVVGFTKSDGKTWAGRFEGEAGKIISKDGDTMHKFYCHGHYFSRQDVEILCCSGRYSWAKIETGELIPGNAVKSGVAKQDGSYGVAYVARFEGECGKLDTDDGRMANFWGRSKGKRALCEILMSGPPKDSSITADGEAPLPQTDVRHLADGDAGYKLKDMSSSEVGSSDPPRAPEDNDIWRLRILQFNIWQEGTEVEGGFEQIVNVIIACKADIVTLSEVRNWNGDLHERLKLALWEKGYTFYGDFVEGGDVGVISRWPVRPVKQVCSASAKRSYLTAYQVEGPQKTICVCSAHLDWKEYALNLVRGYGGNTFIQLPTGPVTDVHKIMQMDEKSGRREAIENFLEFAQDSALEGTPIFLGGDFNECSHLDWTESTKDLFGHNGLVIKWGHSQLLEANDFKDAWRVLHPDPVTHLGATWPSVCSKEGKVTSWAKQADERDRIDFIYYRGHKTCPTVAKAAWLVGPDEYFVKGKAQPSQSQGPFLDAVKNMPWPSDHKGLLVDFEISLVPKAASSSPEAKVMTDDVPAKEEASSRSTAQEAAAERW